MKTVGWICALVLLIAAAMAIVFLVSAPRLLDGRPIPATKASPN